MNNDKSVTKLSPIDNKVSSANILISKTQSNSGKQNFKKKLNILMRRYPSNTNGFAK